MPGPKMQCPECGQVLQSMSRHDYVTCDCPNHASVDGGADYLRCGWRNKPPVRVVEDGTKKRQRKVKL